MSAAPQFVWVSSPIYDSSPSASLCHLSKVSSSTLEASMMITSSSALKRRDHELMHITRPIYQSNRYMDISALMKDKEGGRRPFLEDSRICRHACIDAMPSPKDTAKKKRTYR